MGSHRFSWLNLIMLVMLAGLIYFNFTQMAINNLNPDETYYQELGQHLTASFGGNSPLTALTIKIFTEFGGVNQFAIRFPALLCWSLLMLLIAPFTKAVFQDDESAPFGTLCALTTPALAINSPLIIPDLLLITLSLPTWFFFHQAIEEARPTAWYGAGFFWGLTLLTRFEAAVLVGLTIVMMLLIRPSKRKLLGKKGPYLALILGLLMFSPVWYWNWQHGWNGFCGHRFVWPTGFVTIHSLKQLGISLLGAFTLFLLPLGYYTTKRLITFRRTTSSEYFLISAFLPSLLYWAYTRLTIFTPDPAPIPSAIYLPALVFIAGQLYQSLQQPGVIKKNLLTALIIINLALNGVLFAATRQPQLLKELVELKLPAVSLANRIFPTNSTYGWSQLGDGIDRLIKTAFPDTPKIPIVADSYKLAAELNHYVTAPIDLFTTPTAVRSYFDYLTVRRASEFKGQPGLLVLDKPVTIALNPYFSQIEWLETIRLKHRGIIIRTVYVYRFARLNAEVLTQAAKEKPHIYPGLKLQ